MTAHAPILVKHNRHPHINTKSDETQVCDAQEVHKNEKMAKLVPMVLPWVAMVIASVVAAAVVSWQSPNDPSFGSDSDASNDLYRLLANDATEHERVHDPVYEENHASLFPLSSSDRIGFALAICGLMIAAGGGIGGGGILVPIYILVMGFSPKHGEYN